MGKRLKVNEMLDRDNSRPEPNPNHPKLGDTIKVEPIRTVNAINKIKKALAPSPRNLALFVVGINTAYRASELLQSRGRHFRIENRPLALRISHLEPNFGQCFPMESQVAGLVGAYIARKTE